jgi:TfoX/Sxy family transcriptional regulator of competence genes
VLGQRTLKYENNGGDMAFDTILADRIRHHLARRKNFTERKMFGGVCFLLNGNMCCGVLGADLIIRVNPEETESILRRKHTRIFDYTGKPSRSMVYVGPKALHKDTDLTRWLQITLKVVQSLPPKS